jgi:hypothetical protein
MSKPDNYRIYLKTCGLKMLVFAIPCTENQHAWHQQATNKSLVFDL